MIKISDKSASELVEMKMLWEECFSDTEGFIDFYFDKMCRNNEIVMMKEDGDLVGMLHLNPYTFTRGTRELYRTCFITGAAVREGFRQEGRLKKMLGYAATALAAEGIRFVYARPENPVQFAELGFATVTKMADIVTRKTDLEILRDEMVTTRADIEFGKLLGSLITPSYSAEAVNALVSEMSSKDGNLFCLEKKGVVQGIFSIRRNGNILEVEHVVPFFSLRDFMSRMFDAIEERLAIEEARTAAAEESDEPVEEVTHIRISLDTKLLMCFAQSLDMNQVTEGQGYMVSELRENGLDYENMLFTELC